MGTLYPSHEGFPGLGEANESNIQMEDHGIASDRDQASSNIHDFINEFEDFLRSDKGESGSEIFNTSSEPKTPGPEHPRRELEQPPIQPPQERQLPQQEGQTQRSQRNSTLACNDCGNSFRDQKTLSTHRFREHKKRDFKCICGAEYARIDSLKTHQAECEKYKRSLQNPGSSSSSAGNLRRVNHQQSRPEMALGQLRRPTIEEALRKRLRDTLASEERWRLRCHKVEQEKDESDRVWMVKCHELEKKNAEAKAEWMKKRQELERKLAEAERSQMGSSNGE